MTCYYPQGTYRKDGTPTVRPCSVCIGCRLDNARQWASRCVHESQLYDENCFLTLTYDDDNLPEDQSIHKSDLQRFMKRLRKRVEPQKIRYFGCGEYGENLNRPHYHLALFNYNFPDKILYEGHKNPSTIYKKDTNPLYISEMLGKVWPFGFHSIGDLTLESAGYVARYVTKKINGAKRETHYQGKEPEFALMSRRPGIGKEWIEKYTSDVYPKNYFTINGKKIRTNRYYDSYLEKNNPEEFEKIKEERREQANLSPYISHMRNYQREKYRKSVTKTLERKLENGKN